MTRPESDGLPSPGSSVEASGTGERDLGARVQALGHAAQREICAEASAREHAFDVLERRLAASKAQRAAHLPSAERGRQRRTRNRETDAPAGVAEQAIAERLAGPHRAIGARRLHAGDRRDEAAKIGRIRIDLTVQRPFAPTPNVSLPRTGEPPTAPVMPSKASSSPSRSACRAAPPATARSAARRRRGATG